ncbi:putative rab-like GTPase activating protein [Leishmania infantum JPCM5]|uniref:Disgorgin_-_putative n=2 Tax=Leishmania infantum TaxID=5671 RepID=A0A6L0XXZ9_LEIIN|nr:putative rab-like GTPase activating protein [Leishmania infantum JPCM5]CAC9552921.1 disgorgin_-_putative [Leishmania infantum]CAM73108.1 putative rab-like GTPase activating protein [Leishmania infantum JPCM5]SUZ47014.1 disgorgin_-_putative [Leishmania infantum]|eukprot:XP_001469988.1 putative rab-like GTPase activating protein [Leishmania infantum JPCM5]
MPLAANRNTADSLAKAQGYYPSQTPPRSGTTAMKSYDEFGGTEQVVQVVSSPLLLVAPTEEMQLGRGSSPFHAPQAARFPAACTVAVPPSVASRPRPLMRAKAHDAGNAELPQPLSRSQLRAAPTGGSDSDTEEEGHDSRLVTPDADGRNPRPGNESAVEAEENDSEQQLVDEFGFVIDEDAKERDGKYIRGIDGRQVVRREIKWANMAADWNKTNTKMHAKLKERCRKGIPSRFRGVAWQLLMGSFHQLNSEENNGVYVALRDKKLADKETDAIISRDLARTFPTHVLFQDPGGVGQTFLRNVLHAYAGCDPEVGYVQGMGFLVAALSTQMAEEESFWALHEMMYNERYKMRELFRPGFPLLQQFFYQLKRLIARLLPRLSKRLDELEIQPSFFASQWFLTLFVGHFPFRALLRVWDIFFSEGWKIIFRTGIALLKWEESHLLTLPFEDTLLALKGLQDGKDAYELLRRAHRVKFKTAELNRYGDEYWEMVGLIHRD